jgi:membrane-bound metal-dependent hydrolase YbcI (DUF457 family)
MAGKAKEYTKPLIAMYHTPFVTNLQQKFSNKLQNNFKHLFDAYILVKFQLFKRYLYP